MAPPANKNEVGPNVAHPEGVFLFCGSSWTLQQVIVVHVYIKKHEGEYWFCVEMIITVHATNIRQTIQEWKSVAQYSAIHQELWGKFDMEPNRDFNIGVGLRAEGGEHLNGSSEICESDGTMKMEAIKSKCD
ncbi:hypothetical protein KC340_g13433 [Hortaea werneckii]|nr:hypothetical protein KC342_g17639 [Hortaea werneckii]KAI7219031.1 hypothetical protein KC365_g12436 [Hortaea werneckii]KAI7300230.1 hypothetical protein KC340_g13433 [Hortaea werneckii]KAI7356266.1 hypothetical protein KC336_g22218 [Hortaea werneckii]KAI7401687.1 hypothetical protein KC328_g3088 [Hortaea werneckii]